MQINKYVGSDRGRLLELPGSIDVGLWYCDLPFGTLNWDAKAKEHFGLPGDAEVTIDTFYDCLHPDDRERTRQAIADSIAMRTPHDMEYRTVSPAGTVRKIRWIHAMGRCFYNEAGEPVRFDGLTIDVTHRKQAGRNEIFDGIPDGFAAFDHNGTCQYINRAGAALLALPVSEVAGKNAREVFAAGDDAPFAEALQRASAQQTTTGEAEFLGASGKWLKTRIFPSTEGILVYFRDITAQKRDEVRQRENESHFRMLADSIPQLVWMADPTGYIFWFNRRCYEYTGATPQQIEGWGWQSVLDPEVLPTVLAAFRTSIETGEPFEMVFPLRGANGLFRQFLTRMAPLRDAAGAIQVWFGTNTDISAQRETEAELRASQESLRVALEASATGTFRWDIVSGALDWDEGLDRLFGLRPGETVRSLPHFVERVHPEDRAAVSAACARSVRDGADFDMEFRVVWPDGTLRWLYDRGKTFLDAQGRPAYMTG
ncbi:MAG: PAS domain-containing protein, partial [Acidobacteriota bacterium]